VEYVYTHMRVAHLLLGSSHRHQIAQVAFQAKVALVVVEVHPCLHTSCVVLATGPDRFFGTRSELELFCCQIRSPGRQDTRNVSWGTVRWTALNPSRLDRLSAGCPAGPSVYSYNALDFAVQ